MATSARRALLIGTADYQDTALPHLAGAATDTTMLAEVLADERIGGFEVRVVLDRPAHEVAGEIEDLLGMCGPRDLVLLYFTGHGIKGADGRLYFAAANTDCRRLRSSAVAAAWVHDALDACRSKRQVVLLDCCHSGAFTQGVKAGDRAGATEQLSGRGRVILTASDAIQFALERSSGDREVQSVFTTCVTRGLRTGDADVDGDGLVTLDDLFEYVQDAVRQENPLQTPQMTAISLQGEFVLARNPFVERHAHVSPDLAQAAASPLAAVRLGAVEELRALLDSPDQRARRAAVDLLTTLADDDSHRVSSAANAALAPASTPAKRHPHSAKTAAAAPSAPARSASVARGAGTEWQPALVPGSRRRRWLVMACGLVLAVGLITLTLWLQRDSVLDTGTPRAPDAISLGRLDWQPATIAAEDATGAELFDVAWARDEFIAVGTRKVGERQLPVLLSSPDAAAWEVPPYATALSGDEPRELFAVAAGRGVVVVAGVDGARPDTDAAVWQIRGEEITRASSDGLGGDGYQEIRDVVWDGEGFLAVGCVDPGPVEEPHQVCDQSTTATQRPAVWRSPDGQDWARIPVSLDEPAAMYAVERTDSGFIATGHQQTQRPDSRVAAFWRSSDGRQWTRVHEVDPAVEPVQSVLGLSVRDSVAVAVGWQAEDTAMLSRDVAVWSTTDGRQWRQVLHQEVADRQLMFDVVAVEQGFLAVASVGSREGERADSAIWLSTDGDNWAQQDTAAFRDGGQLMAIAASPDRIVVTARRAPKDEFGTIAWSARL